MQNGDRTNEQINPFMGVQPPGVDKVSCRRRRLNGIDCRQIDAIRHDYDSVRGIAGMDKPLLRALTHGDDKRGAFQGQPFDESPEPAAAAGILPPIVAPIFMPGHD